MTVAVTRWSVAGVETVSVDPFPVPVALTPAEGDPLEHAAISNVEATTASDRAACALVITLERARRTADGLPILDRHTLFIRRTVVLDKFDRK